MDDMCQQPVLRCEMRRASMNSSPASAPRPLPHARNPAPAACHSLFPLPAAACKEEPVAIHRERFTTNVTRTDGKNQQRETQHMTTNDLATGTDAAWQNQNGAPAPTWPGGVRRECRTRLGVSRPPGQGRKLTRAAVGGRKRRFGGVEFPSGSRSS